MSLQVYYDTPFLSVTQVDQTDFFTGDGVTTAFTLRNKVVNRLAGTVEFGPTQSYLYNGGFTLTGSGFQMVTPPPAASQGVAPGLTNLLFDQLFDQSNIPGVSNPTVQEIPFYLADTVEIPLFRYVNLPGQPGIALSIVDAISSYGAATSWIQMACATPDAVGSPLSYQATGSTLYTGVLTAFGTLTASGSSGASSMLVDQASSFYVGDYVLINGGNATQEVVKLAAFTFPHTLTNSGFNFQHLAGETVYACGRKFWMKCTVPINASGGLAANYIDLSLNSKFGKQSRL